MLKVSDLTAIKRYLKSLEGVAKKYPHSKTLAVYLVNEVPFAYLESGRKPLELSVRMDAQLGRLLRDKYEEVANARKLDSRYWSTIVLSGQLSREEITALIYHSYQLAKDLA